MPRTAPVPNMLAIPGMNPGLFVLGGGAGDGGSGAGDGKGKAGKQGADGKNGGKGAEGGGKNAKGCGQGAGGGCPNPKHGNAGTTAGDPVDLRTGRVYTTAVVDLDLPGPLHFALHRTYDTSNRDRDIGLGYGWSHSLAWEVRAGRRRMEITNGLGNTWEAPLPAVGAELQVESMWVSRDFAAFQVIEGGTGLTYRFEPLAMPKAQPPASPTGLYVLTSILDAYGNSVRLLYREGSLVGVADSAGRAVRVRRVGSRIAAFEVQNGPDGGWVAFRSYEHDEAGDLVAARDGYGNATRYTYTDHLLTSQSSPEGLTVYYRYDDRDRCVETWCERPGDASLDDGVPAVLADGKTRAKGVLHVAVEYGAGYVEVVTSRGLRRYETSHGAIDKSVFAGGVHERQYDRDGNLVRYADALGAEWSWAYDDKGRTLRETGPLGDVVQWEYDALGNVEREIRPSGDAVEYLRDAAGSVQRATDPVGLVVAFERDSRGLVTRAETPGGGVTVMEYDAMGNRVFIREPNGGERRIHYNALGLITGFFDERGYETRYVWGAARELLAQHDPDGRITQFQYDRDGNIVAIQGPQGRDELSWGGYRSVVEVRKGDGTVIRFRHDREGDLVRVINERGESNTLTRDTEGRVVAERTFDGRSLRYRLDALGRITRMETEGGEVMEVEYDLLGRVVKRVLPDETEEAFEYDWFGNVLSADNGVVSCAFAYDARGRMVRESQTCRGVTESVSSLLGETGRVAFQTSRSYEQRWVAGATGLPVELFLGGAPAPVRFGRGKAGEELERTLPGGAVVRSTYDALGRLSVRSLLAPGGDEGLAGQPQWVGRRPGVLLEQAYSYVEDALRPARIDDTARGAIDFAYDAVAQIRSRRPRGLADETFTYQAGGNLLDGVVRQYAEGGKLVGRGNATYVYDASNRRIEKRVTTGDARIESWRYEWNGKGLLAAVVAPDGTRIEHTYDPFARRVEKCTKDRRGVVLATVRYVWDGDRVIHEIRRTGSGASAVDERTYAFLPGSLAPMAHKDARIADARSDEPWVYYLCESGGRPEVLVDDRGRTLAMLDGKAFGRMEAVPNQPAAASTPARFAGQWEDAESGLFYNRWRFYDPEVGSYISPEPLGLEGGIHPFRYALNCPPAVFDPDGLMFCTGTPGLAPVGNATNPTIPNGGGPLNPIVQANLANPRATITDPAGCAEPRYLSNHLNSYNPPITQENDPRLRGALNDFKCNAFDETRNNAPRAPCPNCSQLFANMMAKYGAPNPANIGSGATQWNANNNQNFTKPGGGGGGVSPYPAALAQFAANNP